MIRTFEQLRQQVERMPPVTIVIAAAEDEKAAGLAKLAREKGFVGKAVLTGNAAGIEAALKALGEPLDFYEIVHADDDRNAAAEAVKAVRNGVGRILVKGRLATVHYLKAILDKEKGITDSRLLSNLTMLEMPTYHKLICVTDNAIIPLPTLEEKRSIVMNVYPLMKALHIAEPKVAALSALEVVNPNIPSTVDAETLQKISESGGMGSFVVEGPISYDIAISREASAGKRYLNSRVSGDPDILLMPNLEAANILTKSYKYHAAAESGGLVMGASVPVVLNSRSDDAGRRFNSLTMAIAVLRA